MESHLSFWCQVREEVRSREGKERGQRGHLGTHFPLVFTEMQGFYLKEALQP